MHLENALTSVEQQLEKVSEALLAVDPQAVEAGSNLLSDAAVQLSQVMAHISQQDAVPAHVQKRLQAIGDLLGLQRAGLARLAAITGRQVTGLLPPADEAAATYGGGVIGGLNVGSVARLYRSAS